MKYLLLSTASVLLSFTPPGKGKQDFPHSWQGEWTGNCYLLNGPDTLSRFSMAVSIRQFLKDSLYDFHIRYASQDVRPYRLVKGPKPGQWITDEMNSILLPGYYHDDHYIEFFQVNSTLLRSDFELAEKKLKVRIESWNVNKRKKTGDSIPDQQIWNYPTESVQFGVLSRVKQKQKI